MLVVIGLILIAPVLILALGLLWSAVQSGIEARGVMLQERETLAKLELLALAHPDDLLIARRLAEHRERLEPPDKAPAPRQARSRLRLEPILLLEMLAALGLLFFHQAGDGRLDTALSVALIQRNPLAWITLLLLTVVLGMLAGRVLRKGRAFEGAVLLLNVPLIAVIACTDPSTEIHNAAFFGTALLTTLWLLIAFFDASDYLAGAFLLLFLIAGTVTFFRSNGIGERIMLLTLLLAGCWHYGAHLTACDLNRTSVEEAVE